MQMNHLQEIKSYRAEDDKEYAKDLLRGEVLTQDLEQRFLPKVFGEDLENDDLGLGADMLAGVSWRLLTSMMHSKHLLKKGLLARYLGKLNGYE